MSTQNFTELSATEIVEGVKNSKFTSQDVVETLLKRVDDKEPEVQAWVSLDKDYINNQSKVIDTNEKVGSLTGAPIGIKDIFNTEFYPTQKGAKAWKNYKAGNDARCVSYLRDEGAIIFGKTETAELAVHSDERTTNPFNSNHVPGSSSGGSAAAVATGMVPLALGSQTGGSTTRPGSWCGVYAMKPSFGLIPRTGILKTTDTLDTVGFYSRSVADLKLLFDVMRIKGDNFPIQEREINKFKSNRKKQWRIAYCTTEEPSKSYVEDSMKAFIDELNQLDNVEVVEYSLPNSISGYKDLHRRIYHPCLKYYLKSEFNLSKDELSQSLLDIFKDADTIPPEDYAVALQEQQSLSHDMKQFFVENEFDFILTNSSDGAAPLKEPDHHNDFNQLWTMAWLPIVQVPQFKSPDQLPFGFQLVGQRYSDYEILDFLSFLVDKGTIPKLSKISA